MTNPIIGQKALTPLYELFEKFPDIPRTIIIKMDVLNGGIRYTPIINWIGKWSLPGGTLGGYTTFPEETKKGKLSRSQDEVNFFEIPQYMTFRDGTNIQIIFKQDSLYEIRYEGDGAYMLYWNGLAVEEVMFCPKPGWFSKKMADGTPLPLIVTPMGGYHT